MPSNSYSPDGYFENSYNYAALKQYLLDPLSPGGCRRYRAAVFDHITDMAVSPDERDALPSSILAQFSICPGAANTEEGDAGRACGSFRLRATPQKTVCY
jgi:hypothetical protein